MSSFPNCLVGIRDVEYTATETVPAKTKVEICEAPAQIKRRNGYCLRRLFLNRGCNYQPPPQVQPP